MVCWETLGPGIHVDATCKTPTRILSQTKYNPSSQWHSLMSVAPQQDSAPYHNTKTAQEELKVSTGP